jgi:hypothetical protein
MQGHDHNLKMANVTEPGPAPNQTHLEQEGEGRVSVRDVALAALGNVDQRHNDLAERGQRLVDLRRLLQHRPGRLQTHAWVVSVCWGTTGNKPLYTSLCALQIGQHTQA